MRNGFLTTTALALGVSLGGGVMAQDVTECGEGGGVPCLLPDETRITHEIAGMLPACVEDAEATDPARYLCMSGEDVLVDWEGLSDPANAEALARIQEIVPLTLAEGSTDAPLTEEAAPETAEAEAVTEEAAPESAEAETAPEDAAPESAEAEAAPEEAAPETAEAEAAPEEAAPESAEAETAPEDAAPESAEAEAVTEEAAPESAGAETVPVEAAPESAETDLAAEEAAPETAEAEAREDAEPTTEEGILAELQERQQKILDRLNREAEVAEESAAAAASEAESDTDATAAEAEIVVEEQTVTEADTRASDEEFETAVSGASAAASAAAPSESDDGLSAFEKALLVGLGALAVGQFLDNGDEIVSNTGDRVVVRRDGEFFVLKDDDALLRRPGSEVRTERFSDGSTREIVTRSDGVQIVTVRAADGRVLRRGRILPDGTRVLLFDDTQKVEPVRLEELPEKEADTIVVDTAEEDALRRALEAAMVDDIGRSFSLRQIRDIREVRELAPELEVEAVTFETGSAIIRPDQARELVDLGNALRDLIADRPGEVFLVEGHTDAVGSAQYNLALSDRRAETLALALTEYFDVPPENMIVQGYGETALKVPTPEAERANRRAVVRRITPLLKTNFASNF